MYLGCFFERRIIHFASAINAHYSHRAQCALRPVHNTILNNVLHCIVFTSTLVETQHNARIDSDSILTFPYVAFLHQVVKKP